MRMTYSRIHNHDLVQTIHPILTVTVTLCVCVGGMHVHMYVHVCTLAYSHMVLLIHNYMV